MNLSRLKSRVFLFPAHAGVIPLKRMSGAPEKSIPRTRGGDPERLKKILECGYYSPHTRG